VSGLHLDAVFETALLARVPRASWLVREGEETLAAHQEQRFYSGANMIKTFLLAAALDLVERGEARIDQPVAVLPSHRAGGDGVLRLLEDPAPRPLRDLLLLMTALSDKVFTDGGPHQEWVDHPALVGMGLAMAWCVRELGVDVELAPGFER
jgi:hypothetical protein